MAEQLALEQFGRQARTVDGDERGRGARPARVDRPRQHALARAALAADQHGRLRRRDLERDVQRLPHRRLRGLQVRLGDDRADLLLEVRDVRLEAAEAGDAVEDEAELVGRERLGQVVERAAPHRLDRRLDGGVGGDDDDGQARCQPEECRQEVQPFLLAEAKVEEGDLEEAVAEDFLGGGAVARLADAVAHRLEGEAQGLAQAGVVVDQEGVHGGSPTAVVRVGAIIWNEGRGEAFGKRDAAHPGFHPGLRDGSSYGLLSPSLTIA